MNGNFSQEAMEAFAAMVGEENFSEGLFDFTRCMRSNGSYYGTNGKCRKGTEAGAKEKIDPKPVSKKQKAPKGLFSKGSDVDLVKVEKAADKWRKKAGLDASPGTNDWKHDRVHVLTHSFLGGSNKIGEWIGQGPKSPTPAEETLVNMVHRAGALKGRGDDYKLSDNDLKRYFTRDIQVLTGRNQIPDEHLSKYMTTESDGYVRPNYEKFITKYREMENTPGFDKLLDAAHTSFTNVGDIML
jgi:hypothetical protein